MKKGFSLIELLIYMGIFSILLISLLQFFGSILSVKFESEATSSVTEDGRYILARLSYDMRKATTVVTPTLGAQGPILHISGNSTDYTYEISGDNLQITNNTTLTIDPLNSANTSVSSINFKQLGNTSPGSKKTIQIIVVVKSKTIRQGGNIQTETFQTTIGTRQD